MSEARVARPGERGEIFAGIDPATGDILVREVASGGMDTQSGRIYLPDEYADRKSGRARDRHQAKFKAQDVAGKIVEVSPEVAIQQLAGQEALARKARRKAAKLARRANR